MFTVSIDTDTMTSEQIENALFLVLNTLEPQIGIKKVEYKINPNCDDAVFKFYRDTTYKVDGGWLQDNDVTILNVVGKEFLIPKCYGGKLFYHPVCPYDKHYYATDDQVKDFWMDNFAGDGVGDISIVANDNYLEVVVFKEDDEDDF